MILEHLKAAVAKTAAEKLNSIYKNIPVKSAPDAGIKPSTPKPASKSVAPITPKKLAPSSPSSYGALDHMSPPVSAGGAFSSPGAAYSNGLGKGSAA